MKDHCPKYSLISPLRYPGGKGKLAKYVALLCKENGIKGHYVEPYAGGASVALFLLINGYVKEVTINDIDRSVYAFWHSVLNSTDQLCERIMDTHVTIDEWKRQHEIQKRKSDEDLLTLGFSTFFLNRTNISGILDAGPIGGLRQGGNYKLDCRFNKDDLVKRIQLISQYRDSLHLYNLDAVKLVQEVTSLSHDSQTIYYFDPPYYVKGSSLYINFYKHDDHKNVSDAIKGIRNARWLVSYDNHKEIKSMYIENQRLEYTFFYTAHRAKEGKELLFFSDNLTIPDILNPISINNNLLI